MLAPPSSRLHRPHLVGDAVTVLTGYLITLTAIPAQFVVGPLGGAGSPAQILGMLLLGWWALDWLSRPFPLVGMPPQLLRRFFLFFLTAVLISYVSATTRPIGAVELQQADLGMLTLASWAGILLSTLDAVPSKERLAVLLRRVTIAGGAMATLGIVQFETGQTFTNYLRLPGLTQNGALHQIVDRGGFARPAGTAVHPIEYGVVITAILPLALHFALQDRHRPLLRRWFPVGAIALAVPISISRSAILGAVIGMLVLVPTWSAKRRRGALVGFGVLLLAVFVALPGILGTLLGLFTGIGGDSSALSRTGSYDLAWQFITKTPVFGRGFATFLPAYRILDNQYLLSSIELGFVGLLALVGLFGGGMLAAQLTRRRSADDDTRQLAQALTASIAAIAASFALFDALSFPMIAGMTFFLLGCTGALSRVAWAAGAGPVPLPPASPGPVPPSSVPTENTAPVENPVPVAHSPLPVENSPLPVANPGPVANTGHVVHSGPVRRPAGRHIAARPGRRNPG